MNFRSDKTAWQTSLPGFLLLGGVAASLPEGGTLKSILYGVQAAGGLAWYAAQRPPKWMPTLSERVNENMRMVGIATSIGVPLYMLIDSFLPNDRDKSKDKSDLDVLLDFNRVMGTLGDLYHKVFGDDQPTTPVPVPSGTTPMPVKTSAPPATPITPRQRRKRRHL